MNTAFNYLYRDASNYKKHGCVVFAGGHTQAEIDRLNDCLQDGEFFIADAVGVPEVFLWEEDYPIDKQDDHCWHQVENILECDLEPTDHRTFSEFVKDCEAVAEAGWEKHEFEPEERR